jgi:threonine dehydrogenase-like Zn-dependent dehydrogenase
MSNAEHRTETLAMRSVVFDGGPKLVNRPVPRRAQGEALVRVRMAGICNTDLELLRGYMGFRGVPGHEFVGEVERADSEALMGRRVVGEINCVCGTCRYCRLEMPHHCLDRTVLGILGRDGAFAEYLTLPERNLHLVPASMPDDVAVFAEPVAAAFRILEQVPISGDNRVVVLGDGKLGQLIAQVLRMRTKQITCVGKHAWKLALLKKHGVRTALHTETIENAADVVVDATGSGAGLARALELVRPEGTIVLKTTVAGGSAMDMSLPVINEVRIIGSRCGPFRPALEALALGTVEVRQLISAVYPLAEAVHALEHAGARDALKVLMQIS